MPNSSIWVLVATEYQAAICESRNGLSVPLRSLHRMPDYSGSQDARGCDGERARAMFACELMSALCRGARSKAYDGVIIVADKVMMEALRAIRAANVSHLLIAEIIGIPQNHFAVNDDDTAQEAAS